MEINNKIIAGIFVVAIIGILIYVSAGSGATVSATGNAEVKGQADVIQVYLNIDTKADTAKEAQDENSRIADEVVVALLKLGLERKDIQLQDYRVYEDFSWENGRQQSKGFRATQSVVVKLSDFAKAGDVVDASVSAGALVNWINFELSQEQENELKAQVLKEAGEDAKAKAEATASGVGKKLGSLVSVQSQDFYYQPYRLYENAVAGSSGKAEADVALQNVESKDIDVSATISVVYKIRSF